MKKKKAGRPAEFRPEYCAKLIEYLGNGGTYNGFAGSIGVTRETLYNWEKLFPIFADAKKLARDRNENFIDKMMLGHMTGKIKGNTAVLIFYAKNMRGWRDNPEPEEQLVEEIMFVDKTK